MSGEFLVDEGVVGVEQVGQRPVFIEEMAEEKSRLGLHRCREVLGIKDAGDLARRRLIPDLAEVQPGVEEGLDESVGSFVLQHALDLCPEDFGLTETAVGRGGEESGIGRSCPEGVGKARGEVVGAQQTLIFRSDLAEVEKGGRAEDALDRVEGGLAGGGFFVEASAVGVLDAFAVLVVERTPEGLFAEGEKLVESFFLLEAAGTEDGDFLE